LWKFVAAAAEATGTSYAASVFRGPAFASRWRCDFTATVTLTGRQRAAATTGFGARGALVSAFARELGAWPAARLRRADGGGVLFRVIVVARFALFVTPQHENLAQVLHTFAAHFFANLGKKAFARFTFVRLHSDLDQRVCAQREVNLVQNSGCQTVLPHHDHRVKMMRGGA